MSGQRAQTGEGAAATQTFGALTIDKRVLRTPSRTISIRNIATISVGTHVQPRSAVWAVLAVLAALVAIAAFSVTSPYSQSPQAVGTIAVIVAIIFVVFHLQPQDKTHYLLISTSDGVLSRFTGPRRETLDEVRDILTQKINADDETSTFTINFENGTIENLNVREAGSIHHATHVSGTGHTVAGNGATAVSGQGNTVQTANGGNGRVATADTVTVANRSPGAQLGNGHQQNGAAHVSSEQYVDFSQFLPAVVEMHRFYARQPNAEHLEQRLHELELLMRAGAPGGHQKSRVRELTGEVSQILQAYPSAVQIFQNIAGLMG